MARRAARFGVLSLLASCVLLTACDACCPKRCDPCARPLPPPAAAPVPPSIPAPPAKAPNPPPPKTPVARWPDVDCGGGVTGRAILEELKAVASEKGWTDVVDEISWWMTNCWQDDGPCCRDVRRALDAAKAGDHAACRAAVEHPVH